LNNISAAIVDKLRSHLEQERTMERRLESFSQKLWPWSEKKLFKLVILLAVLDYLSTYAFLTFGSSPQVIEGGLLAGWALRTGGFFKLFLVDTACIGALTSLAFLTRSVCFWLGFRGLGRATFVVLLIPYFVVIMAVVYNNLFWALI
jgi:hypothetical protein